MVRLIAVVWLVVTVASCVRNETAGADGVAGPLVASLQVYTAGAEVGFVFQVTNVTSSELEVEFGTGQSYDFIVRSGSAEVWRWSEGRSFTQALRRERLGPGESWRFEATWVPEPGLDGELTATGVLNATDHRVEQSTRIILPNV